MHDFQYKNGKLCCEDVPLDQIAAVCGTPTYVYSYKTLTDHLHKIQDAFKSISPLICYSMKANSNIAIVRALVKEGAGVDVVSGGELYRAIKAKVEPSKIVYTSIGKTEQEIKQAIKKGILMFNVESQEELVIIENAAREMGKRTRVSIRVNPDVSPYTHKYIATGKKHTKFGLDIKTTEDLIIRASVFSNIHVCGIHIHIGSQIVSSKPFVKALNKISKLIQKLKKKGVVLQYLNIGGGLGIIYKEEKPQTAKQFADAVLKTLKNIDLKIIMEPGRFIVGNAGVLLTKVLYIKHTPVKRFVIVDAGMNDLIRPTLYRAYHQILPVGERFLKNQWKVDVVGPVCESGDFFALERQMARVCANELLSVMSVGAYGFSMSSNYNSRRRSAEVLVQGSRFELIRKREDYKDLVRGEKIPQYLEPS
ncbi:diaminopimelate decarboxylase [bacterium Unc6]|nr:diaminopimelate decarboxylase [bacterium Unc6]